MEKEKIQFTINYLALKCLQSEQTFKGYTDKDLEYATLVFTYIFFDVIFASNQHLSKEKQLDLAETTGKAIRELIRSATGKDMWKIVKQK